MAMLVYQRVYSMLLLIREFAQNTSMCQEARIKMDPKGWLVEMTYIQIMSLCFVLFHLISLWWSQSCLIIQIEIVYSIQFYIVTFILTSIHTHTYIHIHTHTYIRTHTDIHACMHTYVHTYGQIYTHTHYHRCSLYARNIPWPWFKFSVSRQPRIMEFRPRCLVPFFCVWLARDERMASCNFRATRFMGKNSFWRFFHDANGYLWFPNTCMKTTMIRKHQPKELADHSPRLPLRISDANGFFGNVFLAEKPGLSTIFWHHKSIMICIANPIHHLWYVKNLHAWRTTLALLCQSFRSIGSSMYNSWSPESELVVCVLELLIRLLLVLRKPATFRFRPEVFIMWFVYTLHFLELQWTNFQWMLCSTATFHCNDLESSTWSNDV